MSKTHSTVIKKERFRATRPLDYIYDPLFVVSGERDYNRMIMKEIVSNSQYSIRPIYESMFSDMLRYPRAALVLRTSEQLPANFDITYKGRLRSLAGHPSQMTDVDGADRFKFYRRPVTFQSPEAGTLRYPLVALDNITKYAMFSTPSDICFDQEVKKLETVEQPIKPATLTKSIQTDYRETETQTMPWAPPYSVAGRKTPEVLSLACLSWGHGLPAGMHEIEIIERLRMKRAWEKQMDTAESIEKRRKIIAEIENSDWAFREREIQAIHDLRIALAKQLSDQHRKECKEKLDGRVKRVAEMKNKEKDEKLKCIQHKKERALRKLIMKHKGYDPKFYKWNVTKEHLDRTSQIFAPIKRFGTEFRNRHEVLHSSEFLKTYKDLTALENFKTRVPIFDYEKASKPKKKGELCSRETRWTEETLAKLHKDLQDMTAETKNPKTYASLPLKIIQKPSKPKEVVLVEKEISDKDDQIYNAAVLLQKLIHGRATQLQMFNEYKKLKQLVEELATTHTLKSDYQSKISENLEHIMNTRQLELLERRNEAAINSMLGDTQGKTAGMLLDFLAKELKRLQAERNAHALALLAERARYGREAAESGRRQKELQRLKEHDDMFKQVVKIHQETVDMYLEDIVLQAMEVEASEEARSYVQQLARNIDLVAHEAQSRSFELEKEELVADLVFNFALPEANKKIVRSKMKQRQQKYLRLAHDIIYKRKGAEIEEGAVKLTKPMVSEISRVSFREHVSPLHWEKVKETATDETEATEPERMLEFAWSKEGQLRFHMVEDAKILVDTLIEEGVRKIGLDFEEELGSTSQEISQTLVQADEEHESNENEVLLYPYQIKNLVNEILMQTVKKATDIAEWKKEVWSITSDISCLECLQVGSFEGVEFQRRPYDETPVERAQSTDEHDSITKLLPLLEIAYCVAPPKIDSVSSSVQGSQEVVSDCITALCIDAENTLPPLDYDSDKRSPTISEDEETIFMEDSEFEGRELRSITSDLSCLECLHIAGSKLGEMVSQPQAETYDGVKETSNVQTEVMHSHETATSENPDIDDDNDGDDDDDDDDD